MHAGVIHALRSAAVVLFAVFACLALPGSSVTQSGFYRYVDENGQVRFTDNPANVPPDQYQGVPFDSPLLQTSPVAQTGKPDATKPQRIVVNFDAQGGMILVNAVLNRYYPVVFQLDTGASRTMITDNDARALNLPVESADVIRGLIADGSIVEMPVVHLNSIGLGEAVVDNLDVTVGKLRLLGMDFLENFELNINANVGQLVLVSKESSSVSKAVERAPESDAVREDREQAKRDIGNQISQLTIAIKTRSSMIKGYQDDIEELGRERVTAESALTTARKQSRFQSSGVSQDRGDESAASRIEKNIKEIDSIIQNRLDLIKLNEEQIAGMQSRISHLRKLRSRIK